MYRPHDTIYSGIVSMSLVQSYTQLARPVQSGTLFMSEVSSYIECMYPVQALNQHVSWYYISSLSHDLS